MEVPRRFAPFELPGLPLCHLNVTGVLAATLGAPLVRPLFLSRASCGFPSPAEDYVETALDLARHVVTNEPATFYVRVEGDSMTGAGIDDGDLLVVDRSLEAVDRDVIIALVDGEFTVKRLRRSRSGRVVLVPENDSYASIEITEGREFEVWGVVTFTLKAHRRGANPAARG